MLELRYSYSNQVHVFKRDIAALRLSEDRLLLLEGGDWVDGQWTQIAYYDVMMRCWHLSPDNSATEWLEVAGEDGCELLLEIVDPTRRVVATATTHTGTVRLPRATPTEFPRLLAISAGDAEETLAVSLPLGSWDTGNEGWPKRANGDVLISQGAAAGLSAWDGAVGARGRPSALAERRS